MVASNHCQYPILEAMILKVKERCGEWVENQWVVLLPAGERNDWSSPLLAVNKVSGGVVALGDICLCMDFRRVWRRSLEMACQWRTSFRCKRNKGIYYQKFRCNQEGGGVETGTSQEWHLLQGATGES